MRHLCLVWCIKTNLAQVVVSGDGSGVCELTYQRRLGIRGGGALKRQDLKPSISDRGRQHERTDVFF